MKRILISAVLTVLAFIASYSQEHLEDSWASVVDVFGKKNPNADQTGATSDNEPKGAEAAPLENIAAPNQGPRPLTPPTPPVTVDRTAERRDSLAQTLETITPKQPEEGSRAAEENSYFERLAEQMHSAQPSAEPPPYGATPVAPPPDPQVADDGSDDSEDIDSDDPEDDSDLEDSSDETDDLEEDDSTDDEEVDDSTDEELDSDTDSK